MKKTLAQVLTTKPWYKALFHVVVFRNLANKTPGTPSMRPMFQPKKNIGGSKFVTCNGGISHTQI